MSGLGFGYRMGHWTDPQGRSGCTVILLPRGNVTSCDIRGSSPSSRELEHLHPDRKMTEVHAVVLTGASAFGLASADGVMEWLAERGVGYQTPIGVVPIVAAAVVFDTGAFIEDARPSPASGRAACDAATEDQVATGLVGAGAATTVGKWAGREHSVPGGLGIASASHGDARVSAVAVVNSVGDVLAEDGSVVAGTRSPSTGYVPMRPTDEGPTNTVLAMLVTKARLDKRDVRYLAARGSDGITIAVRPAHTRYDGDVVFASAIGGADDDPPDLDLLGQLATRAVADAVRNAVRRE